MDVILHLYAMTATQSAPRIQLGWRGKSGYPMSNRFVFGQENEQLAQEARQAGAQLEKTTSQLMIRWPWCTFDKFDFFWALFGKPRIEILMI